MQEGGEEPREDCAMSVIRRIYTVMPAIPLAWLPHANVPILYIATFAQQQGTTHQQGQVGTQGAANIWVYSLLLTYIGRVMTLSCRRRYMRYSHLLGDFRHDFGPQLDLGLRPRCSEADIMPSVWSSRRQYLVRSACRICQSC